MKKKKSEEDARSRRKQEKLIWSINLARGSVSDFQTISRSRGFNAVFSLFLFFWIDQVEKYRNRGGTSQPWTRETFGGLTLTSPMTVDGKVFV